MISLPKKVLCAPIYRKPHEMKDAVVKKLTSLENLQLVPWVNPSTIFLDKEGLFLLKTAVEGSLKACVQKRFLSIVNVFRSSNDTSERQKRLHYARRRLLISLIAHAWLWERPQVVDSYGNAVTFRDRRVLAPEDILKFLRDTRVHKEHCPCEDMEGFLETVREVPLLEDTSKWSVMGVTACLWWDKLHDSKEGIWCSCCVSLGLETGTAMDLAQESLPPYHETCPPPYDQVYPVEKREGKGSKRGLVGEEE